MRAQAEGSSGKGVGQRGGLAGTGLHATHFPVCSCLSRRPAPPSLTRLARGKVPPEVASALASSCCAARVPVPVAVALSLAAGPGSRSRCPGRSRRSFRRVMAEGESRKGMGQPQQPSTKLSGLMKEAEPRGRPPSAAARLTKMRRRGRHAPSGDRPRLLSAAQAPRSSPRPSSKLLLVALRSFLKRAPPAVALPCLFREKDRWEDKQERACFSPGPGQSRHGPKPPPPPVVYSKALL